MDKENVKKRRDMRDSGLGSFGSESDTSPSASALVKIPESEHKEGHLESGPIANPGMKGSSGMKQNHFETGYFGSVEIDKRYVQPQFWKVILQWIVAEVKRKFTLIPITLDVAGGILKGSRDSSSPAVFEHDLHNISKFSRTHLDTTCFAYVTKKSEFSFLCHVFKTNDDRMVRDIFHTIRDATKTKDAVFQNVAKHITESHGSDPAQANQVSLFEVLYIGKVVVSSKKTQPTFIDDAVDKFKLYEEQKEREHIEKRRHGSGQSVQSLPGNLEKTVNIKENELRMRENNSVHSNDSISSTDSDPSVVADTAAHDPAMPHESSLDTTELSKNPNASNSEESIEESVIDSKGTPRGQESLQRSVLVGQTHAKKNRTMLLQISRSEVCLISPDRKRTSLKRNFKDISFCSQGIHHPEYFGFITRDADGVSFVCYVFMCAAESVVEEVMQTLKLAFEAAFQQSAKTHMCELCPMHQLQKVCEEVDKLPWEQIVDIVTKRVGQLCETDQEEFHTKVKAEGPESTQEVAEVVMMALRHMCEDRQVDHIHISDINKNLVNRYEFTLTESAKQRHSKFDDLKIRAKKSLTESFVTLKERVRHKSGEAMRDIFKDRSWSNESDVTEQECNVAANATSPSALKGFLYPLPTPPTPEHSHGRKLPNTDFLRPRSNTNPSVTSNILQQMRDTHTRMGEEEEKKLVKKHSVSQIEEREMVTLEKLNDEIKGEVKNEEKEETVEMEATNTEKTQEKPERTESQKHESPLKSMFLKAGNKDLKTPSPLCATNSSTKSPFTKPPLQRAGSWRLNILTRVVTPAKIPTRSQSCSEPATSKDSSLTSAPNEKGLDHKIPSQKYRMLWKKAILETMLFIRMKKEMKNLQTRQDEQSSSPLKLEYEEITPCLKQVTKVWTEMLSTPSRKGHKFEMENIYEAVKDGVPRGKRGEIWQLLVEQHKIRHPTLHNMPEIHRPYEELLKQLTTHQHAILIDLGRTFPSHPYFSTQLGAGQLSLFNILKAYSLLDKEVGYCQGLSFVAGILLMHMPESVAFEVMRYLMFALGFRRQYRPDMVALQIQMYQLSRLLHDTHRDLYDYFEEHEIAPTLYAAPWFLTMFASQFPLGFVARVFDVIFLQGSMEVVLKVALVVLGNHKELIKNCTGFESIVNFLKTTLPEMGIIQMERVFNQVFAMDISKQLHAYEVEYHVLQEEMVTTPQRGEADVISRLEAANHSLKRQNFELLEKLQNGHSHNRSLEVQVHTLQSSHTKLKQHIRTLEIERAALLNTMSRIQSTVPAHLLEEAGIVIPAIPHNMTITNSPIHNPIANKADSATVLLSSLDNEVACLMDEMPYPEKEALGSGRRTLVPPKLHGRVRRPSSSEH